VIALLNFIPLFQWLRLHKLRCTSASYRLGNRGTHRRFDFLRHGQMSLRKTGFPPICRAKALRWEMQDHATGHALATRGRDLNNLRDQRMMPPSKLRLPLTTQR